MTIPSTPRRAGPFVGTGSLVSYAFTFKVFSKTDVAVVIADVDGNESTLVIDSSVLVTVNPDQVALPGGSVQYAVAGVATALPGDYTLTILTAVEYKQGVQLPSGGNYRAEVVEQGMDALAVQIQQQQEVLSRALTFSPTDATGSTLPAAAVRADRLLGFDSVGRVVAVAPTSGSAAALAADIANSASVTRGSGQVGIDLELAYAANTAGWGIRLANSEVNPLRWVTPSNWAGILDGTGTGYDATTALQSAINYASNNGVPEVHVPAGIWRFSRLYLHYDAALNPGFNATKMGRIRLTGAGRLQHAEANNWPSEGWHGTVLLSSATTGDCVSMSPASADALPYPSRENGLENLTLVGNTTGFVLKNNSSPSSGMRNVTVLQLNAAGSGVYWHSSWFTNWDTVWVSNVNTTGQTGVGVDFGATLFAGSFRFSNCCFERFRDGFQVNESSQSVALLFDGVCTFQSNARDGLQINAAIRSLVLDTPYMEFNGRSHARCAPASGAVQSLAVRGGFALGGTTSATSMTGPMFYLRSVTNYSIDGLAVFRPWTDVVDVGYYSANGTIGAIKNVCVDASDNNPTSDIYLARTDDQRAMPMLEGNTIFGDANVKEYDSGTYRQNAKLGNGIESAIWNQPVDRRTMGLNGTTVLQSQNCSPVQVFSITGAGSFVSLPGSPGQGRYIVVCNQTTSVSSMLVRQPDQVTNLATVAAGKAVLCYFEPFAGTYIAIGPLDFTGL